MAFRNISVLLTMNSSNFRTQMIGAGRAVDMFEAHVKKASATAALATGVFKTMGLVGLTVLAIGFGKSVLMAAEFEKKMRNVNSISDLSEEALKSLSKEVIALSKVTPQSAVSLAQGLYDIASSGFKGAEGLDVLEASAKAASAGLSTTEVAAKGILAVLNSYGLTVKDAADVSDVLFKAVDLGIFTFEDLAASLGNVVGVASIMGIPIDEVASAMAGMSLAGVSASESAISLNRIMRALIDPSDALKGTMDKLGIGLDTLKDPAIGLQGVMAMLQKESRGNIQVLQAWFPEIRAFRGAAALMTASGRTYARVHAEIADETKRSGATQAAFNEQMKATSNQLALFRNRVSGAMIALGTRMLPVVMNLLKALERLGHNSLPVMAAIATALTPLFKTLYAVGVNVVDVIKDLGDNFGDFAKVMAQIGGGAVLATLLAVATALERVTKFLAENETAAKALALVVGGILVGSILSAAGAAGLLGKSLSFMAGASGLNAIRGWVGHFRVLTALGQAQFPYLAKSTIQWRLALDGVKGALFSTTAASVFAVAELYTMVSAFNNARKAGQEYGKAVVKATDRSSVVSMQAAIVNMQGEMSRLAALSKGKDNIGGWLEAFVDIAVPFHNIHNTLVDTGQAMKGLNPILSENETFMARLKVAAGDIQMPMQRFVDVAKALGIVLDDDTNWATTMQAVADADAAARAGSISLDELAEAFGTLSDETSNAADKLDAYKKAMDAIIGVHITAFEEQTKWVKALRDMARALQDNGQTFDAYTDSGEANRDALAGLAQQALDHAVAVARESESLSAGNEVLKQHVDEMDALMRAAGLTEEQIKTLHTQLGLTPENLKILVDTQSVDTAKQALEDTKNKILAIDNLKPKPELDISSIMNSIHIVNTALSKVFGNIHAVADKDPVPGHYATDANGFTKWVPQRAAGGPVVPGQSYLVGEKGPELVRFHGSGQVLPAHDPRSRAAVGHRMAGGGIFGNIPTSASDYWKANAEASARRAWENPTPAPKGADTGMRPEDIAANRREWELEHATLQRRIQLIDEMLRHETKYSDEWLRLSKMREDAEKEQLENAKTYLEGLFQQRVEIAKNTFELTGKGVKDYLALLDQQIAGEIKYTDKWRSLQEEKARILRDQLKQHRNVTDILTGNQFSVIPGSEEQGAINAMITRGSSAPANAGPGSGHLPVLVDQSKTLNFGDIYAKADFRDVVRQAEREERLAAAGTTGNGGGW